jgi:hypothetical protein
MVVFSKADLWSFGIFGSPSAQRYQAYSGASFVLALDLQLLKTTRQHNDLFSCCLVCSRSIPLLLRPAFDFFAIPFPLFLLPLPGAAAFGGIFKGQLA